MGMGAVLLSRCKIGSDSIVGAHALVTEDVEIASGSMVLGMPARVTRSLTEQERGGIILSASHYVAQAEKYHRQMDNITG